MDGEFKAAGLRDLRGALRDRGSRDERGAAGRDRKEDGPKLLKQPW